MGSVPPGFIISPFGFLLFFVICIFATMLFTLALFPETFGRFEVLWLFALEL